MAIDAGLLDRAGRDGGVVLRLYRWAPHCLSFGRHEPAARRYDRARIEARGLDAVRRPTGGRAVWHARELTYALAAPVAELGGLRAAYRQVHGMLADAARRLGAPARLADEARVAGVDAGACFASPAGGEVMVADGKLVGSAQVRAGDGLLQHGAFLLEDDQAVVDHLTLGDAAPSRAVPLSAVLGRRVAFEEAAAAVREAAEAWRAGWTPVDDPSPYLAGAEGHAARFLDPAWTWCR
jgi:lipoate-protein ligase A